MNLNQKNTALLVFSLSAEREVERKYIFDKQFKKENTTFFKLLINQTKQLAQQSGVDVFWVNEHQQTGFDFSTRFTNAFQKLFDLGYKNVISIGNDCPDLSHEILQDAIEKLRTKQIVLGPSKDGGVYLLGIKKAAFDNAKFLKLPWQTSALKLGLEKYLNSEKIAYDLLHELTDIDSGKDVGFFAKSSPSTVLVRFYKAIIASMKIVVRAVNDFRKFSYEYSYVGLRAPPSVYLLPF